MDSDPLAGDQYAPAQPRGFPAGRGDICLRLPGGAGFRVVPRPLADLLASLRGFRSLREHRAQLLEAGWQDDGSGCLDEGLRRLRDLGLLVSRSDFLARMSGSRPTPRSISSATWVTCGRPGLLRRSLEQFAGILRRSGREVNVAVFDDSGDGRSKEVLRDFRGASGLRSSCCGRSDKMAFIDRLLERPRDGLPGRAVLEFALLGPPGAGWPLGANRNAQLLGTPGELILSTDDDIEFRPGRPPREEEAVELAAVSDPTEIDFHPDRRELLSAVALEEGDWLACHEGLLGVSGPAWVASPDVASRVRLERASPGLTDLLGRGGGEVLLTVPGLYGDCAFPDPAFLLTLDGASRDNLVASREAFDSAFSSRETYRGARRTTVTDGGFFLGAHFGLDNRGLLPPFFPCGRTEDGVFLQMLRVVRSGLLQAYLPRGVLHSPDPPRTYRQDLRSDPVPQLPELLLVLVGSFGASCRFEVPEHGLTALGGWLKEVGSLAPSGYSDLSADLCARIWSARLVRLQGLVDRYRGPAYWTREVERLVGAIRTRMGRGDPAVPADLLAGGRTPEQAMRLAQGLIGRFGELLQGWPVIVERARQLKEEGRGLAVPLE